MKDFMCNIHVNAFIEILKDQVQMGSERDQIRPQRDNLTEFQI
jgi:hypothetical protein